MGLADKNKLGLLTTLLLLLVPTARGQLQVGSETQLNLVGGASLGYVRSWDTQETNSIAYGLDGTLTGSYHDPRFLSFMVSPYFNQSNVNSNFNSNTLASGVAAEANFISDSDTPMRFTYTRDYNRQGTFNVPGSVAPYQTIGSGQSFSANASYLPEDWPTVNGTFVHTGSDYEIVGTPGSGRSHSNLVGVGASHTLWDTNLSASYNKNWVDSETPVFGSEGALLTQNTTLDTFQANANRQLWRKGTINGSYVRSHAHGAYAGLAVDTTNDSLAGNLNFSLTPKLSVGANTAYSTNLSEQLFLDIIGGQSASKSTAVSSATGSEEPVRFTSNFLTYGANANYQAWHDLALTARIDHRVQGQQSDYPDLTSTIMQGIAIYTHKLFGGGFGASYGISYAFTPVYSYENGPSGSVVVTNTGNSTFRGDSASISYGRQLGAWSVSVSGSYGHGLTTLIVGYIQTSYTATGSINRNMKNWNFSVHGSYGQSKVESLSLADSKVETVGASLSHKSLGFSGSYGKSMGTALQVGGGIVPTPVPVGGQVQDLLVQFNGESYSVGASWQPRRRWTMTGSYSYANYLTINPLVGNTPVQTATTQYYARSQYGFRQLFLYIGYNHVDQGYGTVSSGLYSYNNFYVGVTRYFNFF